jgi:hypothetical protein
MPRRSRPASAVGVTDNSVLTLIGAITNSGELDLNSTGDLTTLQIGGSVQLGGGGKVVLSDSTENLVAAASTGGALDNIDNIVSGSGEIGGGGPLTVINEIGGTINANGTNAFVIHASSLTNRGLIESTTARFNIIGGTVTNTGTLQANVGTTLKIFAGVANAGTLDANGGDLIVTAKVTGAGKLGTGGASIEGGGTIEFGAASNQKVTFATGASGMLKLDKAESYNGTVIGFSGPSGGPRRRSAAAPRLAATCGSAALQHRSCRLCVRHGHAALACLPAERHID